MGLIHGTISITRLVPYSTLQITVIPQGSGNSLQSAVRGLDGPIHFPLDRLLTTVEHALLCPLAVFSSLSDVTLAPVALIHTTSTIPQHNVTMQCHKLIAILQHQALKTRFPLALEGVRGIPSATSSAPLTLLQPLSTSLCHCTEGPPISIRELGALCCRLQCGLPDAGCASGCPIHRSDSSIEGTNTIMKGEEGPMASFKPPFQRPEASTILYCTVLYMNES